MATWPRWELQEWPRWLHGQDKIYQSGPDGYIAKMRTNRVAQMATWPRWGLTEWPRWLHGQDGDYQSGPDDYLDMGTTRVVQVAHGQDGNYQSGPDGYMAKMGTNRVAQMATWPRRGLPEWPRWLHSKDGD